ncbi:uncharacterized protein [Drosophila kikkawai]|uniref:Uncharacterized protein n=1 Tax=Drosophila kikkawai TaxID=30033 RepID=A0A6P4IVN4_DROKI|nr:uncharacterized protein LOC108077894 [Drosophila kikkawai]
MHSIKIFLAISLICTVAFAWDSGSLKQLEGDDLTAANELLTKNFHKLLGPRYNIIQWFPTKSSTSIFYKYVVDISDGSHRNECTFTITQNVPPVENYNKIDMMCQGKLELKTEYW